MLSFKLLGTLCGHPKHMSFNRHIWKTYITLTKAQHRLSQGCNLIYIPMIGICNNLVLHQEKKPTNIQLKAGKDLLKNAIEMRRDILMEKKDGFVKDMLIKKTMVKERVREKMEEMEEIVERENVFTIPNLLCVGRGVLAPYLGYVIVQQDFTFAMGLLVFAGVTDIVSMQMIFF